MQSKIEKGTIAERKAESFLTDKGYSVVVRNYRFRKSEIDLIVQKDNWLVFVEVRMRSSVTFGHPEQTISSAKRKKVMEGAAQYLEDSNWKGNVRYDVIAITRDEVEHFEDAFY